ncbi:aroma-sacti cluster domain-containing protein [Nonomuraea sp. NPDC050310]|uniref:aroma-sacti cluster domain-containing protein n=1 Tax=unclassified Nonomuraea TaxID=2593643 RepID=UPI0033E2EB88
MTGSGSGAFDALDRLRASGHPVDLLDERQQRVFAELSEAEVALLNSIKQRLDDVAGEVEGQELKLL